MGTPTAVISVQGTRFEVQVKKKSRTNVSVFEGLAGRLCWWDLVFQLRLRRTGHRNLRSKLSYRRVGHAIPEATQRGADKTITCGLLAPSAPDNLPMAEPLETMMGRTNSRRK
jgi:hypothetical protein